MGDQISEDKDASAGCKCDVCASWLDTEAFPQRSFDLVDFFSETLMYEVRQTVLLFVVLDADSDTL
jgi:hypothetical protein